MAKAEVIAAAQISSKKGGERKKKKKSSLPSGQWKRGENEKEKVEGKKGGGKGKHLDVGEVELDVLTGVGVCLGFSLGSSLGFSLGFRV